MSLYSIIKRPIVTEKTSLQQMSKNVYCVEVDSKATKIDVKKAFLDIYKVEVDSVRILNTREKFKNWRKGIIRKRKPFKKAYVQLKSNAQKIDFVNIK